MKYRSFMILRKANFVNHLLYPFLNKREFELRLDGTKMAW